MLLSWIKWCVFRLILLLQNCFSTDYNYTDDKFLDGTNYGFRFDETNHEIRDSFGNVEEHTQLQGGSVRNKRNFRLFCKNNLPCIGQSTTSKATSFSFTSNFVAK